jgi:hypothetical protein
MEHGMKADIKPSLPALSRMVLAVAALLFLTSIGCESGSGFGGKLIDKDGKPLSGVKVAATPHVTSKGSEVIETKTGVDGSFVLKGLDPEAGYSLSAEGGQCNGSLTDITTAHAGDTKILKENVILFFSPFLIDLDGVVTDPETGLQWVPAPDKAMSWDKANEYVKKLNLAGGGWRLPSKEELRQFYDKGKACGFPKGLLGGGWYVWASDLNGPMAWHLAFSNRHENWTNRDNDNKDFRALAVRTKK